ncbi:hypothetical protein BH09ACT6_BH09ACT6_23300 [soil metagenome]
MLNNPEHHATTGETSGSRPPFVLAIAVEGFENEPTPSYLLRSAADHEVHAGAEVEPLE